MMNSLVRPLPLLRYPAAIRPILAARLYATQTGLGHSNAQPQRKRKAVTAFNDDGRVKWGDLTAREKLARTSQQTFNFSFIIVGAVLTAGVAYVMYAEVFSSDSKTAHFNRAVDKLKADKRCTDLLGDPKKILAFGEETWNKWRRARPIASVIRTDQYGTEHLIMHFNVEGPLNSGVVNMHMIKKPLDKEFVYKYLYVDVRGNQRIWLENADATPDSPAKSKTKFFGISWR